jgi:hypothetical protein
MSWKKVHLIPVDNKFGFPPAAMNRFECNARRQLSLTLAAVIGVVRSMRATPSKRRRRERSTTATPTLFNGFQNRRVIERCGAVWHTKYRSARDQRRDQNGRDPYAEAFEIEAVFPDRCVRRCRAIRRRHVIVAAAVFIVGHDRRVWFHAGPLRSA